MRRLWGGLALSALLASSAGAADLAARVPVKSGPVPVVAAYDWTGCYVGGHVGGLWGRTKQSASVPSLNFAWTETVDFDEFTGGGHIGCNLQVQRFVVGVEFDASSVDVDEYVVTDPVRFELLRTKFDWYSSVRGRFGLGFDRNLIYVTGGVALGRINYRYEEFPSPSSSTQRNGWVAGAGWEYAFASNLVGRAEYLYFDFGHKTFLRFYDMHTTFHVGRIGLSYKFGPTR